MPLDDFAGNAPFLLHERMHHWARLSPHRTAVRFDEQRLTFNALSETSTAVAAVLRTARRGATVTVLMEDGLALVSTLFGVLESGSAFCCPGLDCPPERLRHVLQETGCTTVIVDESGTPSPLLDVLGEEGVELFRCSGDGRLTPAQDRAPVAEAQVPLAAPAYVTYTSGSTGRPKGVLQTHESFSRFLDWQSLAYALRPDRIIAQWATVTYDSAYCEIFGAICYGATVWCTSRQVRHDPHALLRAMEMAGIHVAQFVPSFLRQLLAEIETGPARTRLATLTHLFSTGEPLTPRLAAECGRLLPHVTLTNGYGATETLLATYHEVRSTDLGRLAIPLGQPIDGCEVLLLDESLRPVPPGAVGEVFLAATSIALGYLGRPALTAAAFVPLPGVAGARMYRTGDLAWRTPDGELFFVGRKDNQLKVRGMRVEPGEIEAALDTHPAVRHCAVRARGDGEELRLEAHVVLSGAVTEGDLRSHLAPLVPAHMVPARFRFAESLPRTRNGKTDRAALPEIAPSATGAPAARPSAGGIEDSLAALWEQLLSVPVVTATDDFFELGGQSVDAMRLSNIVQTQLGVRLPVAAIFDAPTLTEYAAVVRTAQSTNANPDHPVNKGEQ
jgi:amino acid adenylation domain-containing protein